MFSQAKKQVNDTNFYSHYISPWACFFFDNLKLPVLPRNITIHDWCTFDNGKKHLLSMAYL